MAVGPQRRPTAVGADSPPLVPGPDGNPPSV
jgi:hypothetical protein